VIGLFAAYDALVWLSERNEVMFPSGEYVHDWLNPAGPSWVRVDPASEQSAWCVVQP